jgi:hypothetical protein
MGQRGVDQLAMPVDMVEFLLVCSGSISVLLTDSQATPIGLGVVSPRGGAIPSFLI